MIPCRLAQAAPLLRPVFVWLSPLSESESTTRLKAEGGGETFCGGGHAAAAALLLGRPDEQSFISFRPKQSQSHLKLSDFHVFMWEEMCVGLQM